MKRFVFLLIALGLFAFAAPPALAQGPRGDHVCFGGDTIVRADETPENVILFGCGARIQNGARVSRDVVSFGGNVILEEGTRVGRNVVVFGGDLQVAGQVGVGITVFGADILLNPTAVVGGNVVVLGGNLVREQGAMVGGQIQRNPSAGLGLRPFYPSGFSRGLSGIVSDWVRSFVTMLGLAALGALTLVFLPTQTKLVGDVAVKSALPSLGVGCLTWLIVPPLMILFILTCLGIPLSLVLGVLAVAAGVFGWIAISLVLGDRLLGGLKVQNSVPLVAMFIGLVILWLVTLVPVLGGLIWLLASALALGAVILSRFGSRPYPLPPTPVAAPSASTPTAPSLPPGETGPSI